jgi:hypothetical protein
MFLPAIDVVVPFDRHDGSWRVERISLSDGGVYDNLGLAPLWPDREPSVSLNVEALDTIICLPGRLRPAARPTEPVHDRPPQERLRLSKVPYCRLRGVAQP